MVARMLIAAAALLLCACAADQVEIEIDETQLRAVLSGDTATVGFRAWFIRAGELDETQESRIAAVGEILPKHIAVKSFDIVRREKGYVVKVEGELPVSMTPQPQSAWYLAVEPYPKLEGFHQLSIRTTERFDDLWRESRSISEVLAPDAFHPTQFLFVASGARIIAPAAEVLGKAYLLYDETVDGRVYLDMRGGAYDRTGAGFLFSLDPR